MTLEQVALGFVRVANEAMCRPIRNLTEGKGYDTRKHLLACFGGAGGQHACAIARSLGIRAIRVNRYSGILSAYGLSLADVVHEEQEPCDLLLDEANMTGYMSARIEALSRATVDYLCEREHFEREQCSVQVFLNLRYADTDTGMMCQAADDVATGSGGGGGGVEAFLATFTRRYRDEYGFNLDRPVYVDDIRVRGIGKSRTTKSAQQNEQDRTGPLKSVDVSVFLFFCWVFDLPSKVKNIHRLFDVISTRVDVCTSIERTRTLWSIVARICAWVIASTVRRSSLTRTARSWSSRRVMRSSTPTTAT